MGIAAFVSDDTKDQGPHQTLVKEIIEDVMPIAFYELLFLKYLNSEITMNEMLEQFEIVTSASMRKHPMNFRSKICSTVRRFSEKYGTKRDNEWIKGYCRDRDINFKDKMRQMRPFLDRL